MVQAKKQKTGLAVDHIATANLKSIEDFVEHYLTPSPSIPWTTWTHPNNLREFEVSLSSASALSEADFEACFELISETSSTDYKTSQDGWKPKAKRKEMKLLDLKYLLVKDEEGVKAFTSLMPTYEDGIQVVYCYEIHLKPELQGTGLGSVLMGHLEEIAAKIPGTERAMLTCFLANERGVRFYEKLGYVKYEYSPEPRILRNGTRAEVEYIIMSKHIRQNLTTKH
ncbi:acyl-CoA N-acyltransferase [Calycina marina]|uniref:N-alpha-acetyltransferase 40 n=1 Tax=Calycina marina TaxID=1763456 RepID=A0A9P7YWC9_9HELO|nr:acyl-CoA N-acyltransferase [Calycina marina]